MNDDSRQPPQRPDHQSFQPRLPSSEAVAQRKTASTKIASVPRRYGLGTLLVITFAFAALFGLGNALSLPPLLTVGLAASFTSIGLAQAVAGPKRARAASMIVGLLLLPAMFICAVLYDTSFSRVSSQDLIMIALGLLCMLVWGAPIGYLGGVLVGGIFLLMRYADAAISRLPHRKAEEEPDPEDRL